MKTLRLLFLLLATSMCIMSCTDTAFDDDQDQPTLENLQATGGEDANPDDGSKE
ncbi:hypothetical protein [Psychroserpens luteolus]|uniref:hypothetical protein n=1 Tax=Psychroserpens luteolus TaxID=2855840 RepID=UPI001E33C85D|nr:hypothetical protein [Psychroserpens luteolus]MCD2258072.1 hypothetical protein [Psychroserpens luteolus]